MIRQISTYGAALLTIMVVIRATTLDQDTDVRSLYQRLAETNYPQTNQDLRSDYTQETSTDLLAVSPKIFSAHNPEGKSISPEKLTVRPIVESLEMSIEDYGIDESTLLQQLPEENDLSLDRESTINSNLSLLFPRQRLLPKPGTQPTP